MYFQGFIILKYIILYNLVAGLTHQSIVGPLSIKDFSLLPK